jgi:restriction endonuclease S subunit
VRITDLQDGKIDWDSVPFCECDEPGKYTLRENDILFARTGATTGKTHLVSRPEPSVFASYLIRLCPKRDVEAGYLHAFFQSDSYWSQISEEKEGSAQPNVNGEKLAALKIPSVSRELQRAIAEFVHCVRRRQYGESVELPKLPPPLAEKRRVVARIEELAAQIGEARGLRRRAAGEAEQIMAAQERKTWPDEALQEAPPLEILTTFLARGRQSEQGESDHYLIKTQHVQQGRYIPTMMRLASHAAAKVKSEAIAQNGDILIACSAAGCLGRVARFLDKERTVSTDTHVAIVRPNPKMVDGDYLYTYLRGAQGQYQLRSRERGDWKREKIGFRLTELNLDDLRQVPVPVALNQDLKALTPKPNVHPTYLYWALKNMEHSILDDCSKDGTTVASIDTARLRRIEIPLPPLDEQQQIVAELDTLQSEVDSLKRLQAETATELDALLPAILDRAFKGEL